MTDGKSHFLINFLIRAVVGMTMIYFANEFFDSQGIAVSAGMNPATFLTTGTFGIPGVALLYGIMFYRIW